MTAAALLFCVAVGSFATSQVILVKEVGVGIALAVLIDATIVRALLVPSLMAILGRWNWWPSRRAEAALPARDEAHRSSWRNARGGAPRSWRVCSAAAGLWP